MTSLQQSITPSADVVASLEKQNDTFATLLSLIPSRYYIALNPEEADSKWMKNKKRKTGEESKMDKRRAKVDKLDPANNLTTDQILESTRKPSANGNSTSSAPASAAQTSSALPPIRTPTASGSTISPLPPAASISELRAKLQSKLDSFRRDRGIDDSDPQSRDALEAARRARRGELRDNRRRDRKEERRKERTEVTAKGAKTQLIVPALPRQTDTLSYPIVALPSSSSSKPKSTLKHISNPTQALSHLEKHQARLEGMTDEKRKDIEERERWAKAEERAAGGKVHDDEKLVRKMVKRVEKGKSKSGQEWADRKKSIKHAESAAIKKRNDNIASRADAKRNKRLGIKDKGAKGKDKGEKKGRPGFEGGKGRDKGREGKDKGRDQGKSKSFKGKSKSG